MYVEFDELEKADLIVDCIYKGGQAKNITSEPLHKMFPGIMNIGGFRKRKREDGSGLPAYVILYTSMKELEWPDYLDEETGIFRYYGDNRVAGKNITDTRFGGNKLLEEVFSILNSKNNLNDIPPFFVFTKHGDSGRSVKFLGLAVPGNPKISSDRDLISFWRTMGENRFQNYEAYFTILDTKKEVISREWINALVEQHDDSLKYSPSVWRKFVEEGRNGIIALKAPKIFEIPSKSKQLSSDVEGERCLEIIRAHYKDNPFGFENCATDIICKMDNNFVDFTLTKPWRDGGRDALGHYAIKSSAKVHTPLSIDCALEAKCYDKNNAVGVKQMSRLISRIRYRQFGILITTSYIDGQAYREVVEDGHPILMITATDIAAVLRNNGIDSSNIYEWLKIVDSRDDRF